MKLITSNVLDTLDGNLSIIFNNTQIPDHIFKNVSIENNFPTNYIGGSILEKYNNTKLNFSQGVLGPDYFGISIQRDDGEINNAKILDKYGKSKFIEGDKDHQAPRFPEFFIYITNERKKAIEYFENTDKELLVEIEQPIGPEGMYLAGDIIEIPDDCSTQPPDYYNISLHKYLQNRKKRRIMFFKDPNYETSYNPHQHFTEIHIVIIESEYKD